MFERWIAYLAFPAFTVLVFALVFLLSEFIRAVRAHRKRRDDCRDLGVVHADAQDPV
jgi:hypothetical protein